MSLDVFDVIILTIHSNNNEIADSRVIQKLIYFHNVMIINLDVSGYTLRFYGPYNIDVAVALSDLSEFSYITEYIISDYYEKFNYKLTNSGIKYAEIVKDRQPNEFKTIFDTIQLYKKCCNLALLPLSYAAKAHYILAGKDDTIQNKYSIKDVEMISKNFGWNVTKDTEMSGLNILKNLKLVC